MEAADCFDAAERNLSDARRYFEIGQAVNWVPDRLRAAVTWAMEGWLLARNYEVIRSSGLIDTLKAFGNAAPPELYRKASCCYLRRALWNINWRAVLTMKSRYHPWMSGLRARLNVWKNAK